MLTRFTPGGHPAADIKLIATSFTKPGPGPGTLGNFASIHWLTFGGTVRNY